MDWVKVTTDYYRDAEIAMRSDATEVMFIRGCALAGEIERHGFIPDALLHTLTRKPAQAKKLAAELVRGDLWERVRGGYQIVSWEPIQAELEKHVQKKLRDRDRKRRERADARAVREASGAVSEDASLDSPAPRPEDRLLGESKSKRTTAAARGRETSTSTLDLPPAVEILRTQLEAHKLTVRWGRLTTDELAEIEALIAEHGDAALIRSAKQSYRPDSPPVYASAWLGQWRELRKPGHLELVEPDPCTEPGHSGTTRHCIQCASERKAAR